MVEIDIESVLLQAISILSVELRVLIACVIILGLAALGLLCWLCYPRAPPVETCICYHRLQFTDDDPVTNIPTTFIEVDELGFKVVVKFIRLFNASPTAFDLIALGLGPVVLMASEHHYLRPSDTGHVSVSLNDDACSALLLEEETWEQQLPKPTFKKLSVPLVVFYSTSGVTVQHDACCRFLLITLIVPSFVIVDATCVFKRVNDRYFMLNTKGKISKSDVAFQDRMQRTDIYGFNTRRRPSCIQPPRR